jgi:histone-lysine N-methyltransferase SETMAR
MLHDNARPHTVAATQDLIEKFGWEQIDHPPYSPDLVLSEFHVFLHLKTFLGVLWFHDDNEVKEAVKHVVCIAGGIILRYRDTKTDAPL